MTKAVRMRPFLRLPIPMMPALLLVASPLRGQTTVQAGPVPVPWVVADSARRTATIALEVTAPAGSPSARLNGYREGGVQVVVPLRWTVTLGWRSADSSGKHSVVVMAEREKIPGEGGSPAFTNAMSRSLTGGLAAGETDRISFEADQPGWYWILCGVPGHVLKGEWIGLRVDPEARTAGVKVKTAVSP
jgi:Sulfocyanin (SoxE) domain